MFCCIGPGWSQEKAPAWLGRVEIYGTALADPGAFAMTSIGVIAINFYGIED